jgi:hypothetical protein
MGMMRIKKLRKHSRRVRSRGGLVSAAVGRGGIAKNIFEEYKVL